MLRIKKITSRGCGDYVIVRGSDHYIFVESHNESLIGNVDEAALTLGEAKKVRDTLTQFIEAAETAQALKRKSKNG